MPTYSIINNKMKNIYNALTEVTELYTLNTIDYEVSEPIPNTLWVVNVYNRNAPGSLLKVEVIDDNGIAKCSVLEKVNVGFKSMSKFMNRLVDAL